MSLSPIGKHLRAKRAPLEKYDKFEADTPSTAAPHMKKKLERVVAILEAQGYSVRLQLIRSVGDEYPLLPPGSSP